MQNSKEMTAQSPSTGGGGPERGRLFYRHPIHRILGGVCGGLADYLGVDPTLVRVLWVVLTLMTAGSGFLAYLVLWVLLPVGTQAHGLQGPAALELSERNMARAGALLVGLGLLWLLANLGLLPWLWGALWQAVQLLFWPVLLMGAGFVLLNNRELRQSLAAWRERTRRRMDVAAQTMEQRMGSVDLRNGLARLRERIPVRRSRTDCMFLGVCGGIGRALGIDPNLVRLLWAAFSLGSLGTGILLYVGIAYLLPEERSPQGPGVIEAQDVEIVR